MLRDVKQYYLNQLSQLVELKLDLDDYKQAVADGNFTEDQLKNIYDYVARAQENVDRLGYILHLFNLPADKKSRKKYLEVNRNIEEYFKTQKADSKSVIDENTELIAATKKELEKLTKLK